MTKLLSLAMALCLSLTLQTAPIPEVPAAPPPDFEIVFHESPVALEAGKISFTLRNNTGEDAQVLLIPRLERQDTDGAWTDVPFLDRVGFCGMADPMPAGDRSCIIEPLELWGAIEDGHYRLHYDVAAADGTKTVAQGEFDWQLSLQICGYPLAEDLTA